MCPQIIHNYCSNYGSVVRSAVCHNSEDGDRVNVDHVTEEEESIFPETDAERLVGLFESGSPLCSVCLGLSASVSLGSPELGV